jgi:hypothetical protein
MPLGKQNIDYFSDPNKFYRVVRGQDVYDDIVESQKIRTAGSPTYRGADYDPTASGKIRLDGRPTTFPSFAKGQASMSYASGDPNHYIIETGDKSLQPSKMGRHGKDGTHFPTDEAGNHLKEMDAKKTKIWKHIGGGQYKPVSPRLQKIGKSLLGLGNNVAKGLTKGLALAPIYEFLNPPSLGPVAGTPEYELEMGRITMDEFKRLKQEELDQLYELEMGRITRDEFKRLIQEKLDQLLETK